jgi:hypothetical protein
MSEVIELSSYLDRSEGRAVTPVSSEARHEWTFSGRTQATGFLNISALQRLEPDTQLSKFLALASEAISQIEMSEQRLLMGDALGADDELMATKNILSELLMYRDVSDAVGLVAFKCFEATSKVSAIVDVPLLPQKLKRALQRIWSAPFMNFDEACELASDIESVSGPSDLVGYIDVANELIGDALVYDAT